MPVRPATPDDASALAALHMATLPGDVSDFTPLGARIVRRFYANAIARGAASVFIAEEDGVAAGFVMITRDVSALFPRALLAGVGDVVAFVLGANPIGLARAAVTKLASGTAQVAAVPELVYIGVDARFRGRGLGAALMDAAERAFAEAGVPRYELNVHGANETARRLYEARGFTVARRYEKGGHAMLNMTRVTGGPAPAASR